MKKSLILLLAAPLLLASCGGSSVDDVKFNSELKYTEKLTDKEVESLNKEIFASFENLESIHVDEYESENDELTNQTETTQLDAKFYSNSAVFTGNGKVHAYRYGVTEDYNLPESKSEYWMIGTKVFESEEPCYSLFQFTSEKKESKAITYSGLNISIPKKYGSNDYSPYISNNHQILSIIYAYLGLSAGGFSYYNTGVGKYDLVKSEQTKLVTQVPYGSGTREQIDESDTQRIIKVENNRIVSYTSYYSSRSNRDMLTGTWYDDVKEFELEKASGTFKYSNNITTRSLDELKGVIDHYADDNKINHVLTLASLDAKVALTTNNPAETLESSFTATNRFFASTEVEESVAYQDVRHANFQFGVSYASGETGKNAILEDVTINAFVLRYDDGHVAVKKISLNRKITDYGGPLTQHHCEDNVSKPAYFRYAGYGSSITFTINLSLGIDPNNLTNDSLIVNQLVLTAAV